MGARKLLVQTENGLPRAFRYRGRRYVVVEVAERWKDTGRWWAKKSAQALLPRAHRRRGHVGDLPGPLRPHVASLPGLRLNPRRDPKGKDAGAGVRLRVRPAFSFRDGASRVEDPAPRAPPRGRRSPSGARRQPSKRATFASENDASASPAFRRILPSGPTASPHPCSAQGRRPSRSRCRSQASPPTACRPTRRRRRV